jgi:hypothetical protein
MKYIKIDPDGTVTEKDSGDDLRGPGVEAIAQVIHQEVGGFFELLPRPGWIMYGDEEAKLKSKDPNPIATALCSRWLGRGDYIAGSVVVFGPARNAEETDCTPDQVALVYRIQRDVLGLK